MANCLVLFRHFKEVMEYKLPGNIDLTKAIEALGNTFNTLAQNEQPLPQFYRAMMLLSSMPKNWEVHTTNFLINHTAQECTWDAVRGHALSTFANTNPGAVIARQDKMPAQAQKLSAIKKKGNDPNWKGKGAQTGQSSRPQGNPESSGKKKSRRGTKGGKAKKEKQGKKDAPKAAAPHAHQAVVPHAHVAAAPVILVGREYTMTKAVSAANLPAPIPADAPKTGSTQEASKIMIPLSHRGLASKPAAATVIGEVKPDSKRGWNHFEKARDLAKEIGVPGSSKNLSALESLGKKLTSVEIGPTLPPPVEKKAKKSKKGKECQVVPEPPVSVVSLGKRKAETPIDDPDVIFLGELLGHQWHLITIIIILFKSKGIYKAQVPKDESTS